MTGMNLSATRRDDARLQSAIGLSLAAGIFTLWLATHLLGIFFLDLSGWNWLLAVPLILVQTWTFVGLFIVAHDAMHGSLAPTHKRLGDRIGQALLLLYAGFGWQKLRAAHFDHHKYAGSARDPDFDADHPRHFAPWYLTFLKRYFGLASFLYVNAVVATYVLLLGARVPNVLLFYALPAIASSLQLFYFGTYRPHRHEDEDFADRHNARTLGYSWAASLFSCFHFGYHHEHHLAPGIPWWGLPGRYRAQQDD
ncbi:MAG: fatty acid desaturase [Novosphingopyxis baekryungensis]|nr:fatty acid desaturase [Novosphingopyxis baekryungensis]